MFFLIKAHYAAYFELRKKRGKEKKRIEKMRKEEKRKFNNREEK